jgi:purine-binding chemotaxis protein CheW
MNPCNVTTLKTCRAGRRNCHTSSNFSLLPWCTEEYGIDIQKVQELRGYDSVTRIANSLAPIKGVVNLRGVIVPCASNRP